MSKFSFTSVNMWRCNAEMHALLNGNLEDDILFVQELWFGRIETARDDMLHSGKSVLGGAANAQWTLHYPCFTN